MAEKEVFSHQIDYLNKAKPVPKPSRINDIDTKGTFYDNIIEAGEAGKLDLNSINNFTNISNSRDRVYDLIDLMCEDPIISAAVDIYTSDVCEPNDKGEIVWVQAEDNKILATVSNILDSLNVNKNSHNWIYNLVKYGDIYLRLYRESEYNSDAIRKAAKAEKKDDKTINEDVIMKFFSKNDRYAQYMEMVKNPAEVFDLRRLGKSYGYLRTHINHHSEYNGDIIKAYDFNQFNFNFKRNDVDVFSATEYVHACMDAEQDRTDETVNITTDDEETDLATNLTYSVRRGRSLLYNVFKIWRELSLLENSVLLNRLTRSSIVRTVSVEVGDMDRENVRTLLARTKQLVEQKSAINVGSSLSEYTNPGPIENVLYIPTHEGIGAVTASQIGGDASSDDMNDVKYWRKKLYAALGIPGQFLGDTEDNTGFNGGTSLTLISSRYAKSVKKVQTAYIQALTDAVNLMLIDRGLIDYINKFTLMMQQPMTQEMKDRSDKLASTISNIQSIMGLLDMIEEPKVKLEILKSLLSDALTNEEVITFLQDEIERLEESAGMMGAEGEAGDLGGDFGGGGFASGSDPLDFSGGDLGDFDANAEMGDVEGGGAADLPSPEDAGMPTEDFLHGNGGKVLNERENLPSWNSLGVSFETALK